MTRPIRRALILAAFLCAMAVPSVTNAATVTDCQVAIDDLRTR